MVTRRSIMALLGMSPAMAQGIPTSTLSGVNNQLLADVLGLSEAQELKSNADLPPHLQKLVHHFDTRLGDMGRGHALPLDQIIDMRKELLQYGFEPYLTPGLTGFNSQFIPLYSPAGMPAHGIWFGFIRERQGKEKGECIAFEVTPKDVKEFCDRTEYKSLHSVMDSVAEERERCINIVRDLIPKRPRTNGLPSSYDAQELSAESIFWHHRGNHELRRQWQIQRLYSKSAIARMNGTNKISDLDDDDLEAVMDLGIIP
jgi:hypothetical protein